MAISFMNALFASGGGDLEQTPFWVLMTLCWHVNESDAKTGVGSCWPSTKTIAQKAHVSELTARKAIKTLIEKGLITAHQPAGGVRTFTIRLDRLKDLEGGKEVDPPKDVYPLKDVEGAKDVCPLPLNILRATPARSLPTPPKDLYPETGKEHGIETGKKQEECVHAQEPLPPPPTDSDLEAMCAQYDGDLFNGAVEPVSEKPRAKTKRIREPLVPLPETLPDDWRALAKERRPEIDPDALLRKMRVRYGPLVKKTMTNWKRTFLNWLARERYYPAPQWQQRRDNRPLQREDMTYTDDF